jgi:7-carboxy-7-deazaguanine synthase
LVVCSPKYIDSAWQIESSAVVRADYLKFIYHDQSCEDSIVRFIMDHHIPAEKIYIMPEGATRKVQLVNMAPTFAFCLRQGFTMTPRLHILAFDDKRGV